MKCARFIFALCTIMFASMGANAELMNMVNKIGLKGCNSAIEKNFASYIKAGNGRVTVDYFKKTGPTFSIMATWGDAGDTMLQRTIFVKEGGSCNTYQTSILTTAESCMSYKETYAAWKYVATSGDYVWTKNSGNVDALMKTLPKGGCSVTFNVSSTYPAD